MRRSKKFGVYIKIAFYFPVSFAEISKNFLKVSVENKETNVVLKSTLEEI